MYEWLKGVLFPLLKVGEASPEPPAGHERDEFLQIIRACPSYLQYNLFFWKLYALAWGATVVFFSGVLLYADARFIILLLPLWVLALVKVAVFYVVARLDYEMRWYVITDRSLLIRQGVWIVREITLTFVNAQNVRIKQGPLQRWFGIFDVEVDTAGGGSKKDKQTTQAHRAVLRGLSNPEPVRDRILNLLRRHRTAGLGDPGDDTTPSAAAAHLNPDLLNEIWSEARALREAIQKTVKE